MHEKLELIRKILSSPFVGFDVETTGLRWYQSDTIFGASLFNDQGSVYCDVRTRDLSPLYNELIKYTGTIFAHNAKFEMHFLAKEKEGVAALNFWCTQAMHRLVNNTLPRYSLEALGERLNFAKNKEVEEWISKNKAYTLTKIEGKKTRVKNKHFFSVPLELIAKYCIRDSEITYNLGMYQFEKMKNYPIALNERELTRTLFKMEEQGVKLDTGYVRLQKEREDHAIAENKELFEQATGEAFVDSGKKLATIFDRFGVPYPTTPKGNPNLTKKTLPKIDHPIVKNILAVRRAQKRGYTYYANFLDLCGNDGRIHGYFWQGGTATGRMSASEPNLQNLSKDKTGMDNIRKSFIAEDGFIIASLDYDQFEYRMALNEAEEMGLIERVLGGMDVHTATAELMNVSRDVAKTVNFLLLYGGGPKALRETLGCTDKEAKSYFDNYHKNIPAMSQFFKRCIDDVYKQGYIVNCFGRKVKVPEEEAYKAVNYKIQGGTADWVKLALNKCSDFLKDKQSRIITQVHDEINFEIHLSETHLIEELKSIMENIAPTEHLKYTCGVKIGYDLQNLVTYTGEIHAKTE
jgi:DNA polymerase I-like protein with 3'-5' exonuclease and polymerase domains